MKIQLDLKALERLIGGDTTAEVELRNSIVQEFTRRHLKSIINSDDFKSFINNQLKEVKQLLDKEIDAVTCELPGRKGYHNSQLALKEEVIDMIRTQVNLKLFGNVEKIINDKFAEQEPVIKQYIDERIGLYKSKVIDALVIKKFNAIINSIPE